MKHLQSYQKNKQNHLKIRRSSFFLVFVFSSSLLYPAFNIFAALSCNVTTQASCNASGFTTLLRLSGSTNAHVELPSQSNTNYDSNVVCCSSTSAIGNSCSGNFKSIARISGTTNGTTQQTSINTYGTNVCLSDTTFGDTITTGYQSANCNGYDTTMFSMSSTDNAHVGDGSAYTIKACATVFTPSISFSISANTVNFGTLSSVASRYADTSTGSATEVTAHTISASSNASSGYIITIDGTTLLNGAYTIDAIGPTNTAPNVGTKQFGLRMTKSGTGTVSSPYAASGFALNIASFPDEVASGAGDGTTTTYSVKYLGNITPLTQAGSYKANLNYLMTSTF